MGRTGSVVKQIGIKRRLSTVTAGTRRGAFAMCLSSVAGMVRLQGPDVGQRESKRWVELLALQTASEVPKELSHSILVCEGKRAASTSPNDVTGLTNEEIRKWFLFSSKNTLVEFPQQVSTSAFRENSSVLVIQQKNKKTAGRIASSYKHKLHNQTART